MSQGRHGVANHRPFDWLFQSLSFIPRTNQSLYFCTIVPTGFEIFAQSTAVILLVSPQNKKQLEIWNKRIYLNFLGRIFNEMHWDEFFVILLTMNQHQLVDSLRPSDTYASVNLPSLVQIMSPSHYLNQCWNIVNLCLRNKHQWNINRNKTIFICENTSENIVCQRTAILARPQCFKKMASCRHEKRYHPS